MCFKGYFEENGVKFCVNFVKMVQKNVQTGFERRIRCAVESIGESKKISSFERKNIRFLNYQAHFTFGNGWTKKINGKHSTIKLQSI